MPDPWPPPDAASSASSATAGGLGRFFSSGGGSGLHLAHTVRVMKVYGITEDNLKHLQDNHNSASRHWGYVTFCLGMIANVFTNIIFQGEMPKAAALGAIVVTLLGCGIVAIKSREIAKQDDANRDALIDRIRKESLTLNPKDEELLKLLEKAQTTTAVTAGPA